MLRNYRIATDPVRGKRLAPILAVVCLECSLHNFRNLLFMKIENMKHNGDILQNSAYYRLYLLEKTTWFRLCLPNAAQRLKM